MLLMGRKGAFGSVFKEVLDDTQAVAVKHMSCDVEVGSLRAFAKEITIMHGCRQAQAPLEHHACLVALTKSCGR